MSNDTTPAAELSISELFDRHNAARLDAIKRAQLLDAQHTVLTLYDVERSALGHDYGNGQRYHELMRVLRELESARNDARLYSVDALELNATPEQQRAAFRSISTKRLNRYQRDAHTSSTAMRAVNAWRAVARELESLDA